METQDDAQTSKSMTGVNEQAEQEVVVPESPEATDEATHGMSVDEAEVEGSAPALPYPLVAIGASAGGLQAFRELLEQLPQQTGMAFVLVTHLAPDQKSYLTEILDRHTPMPVQPIEEGQRPQPDNVYVLLPNEYVQLKHGQFRLEERRPDDRVPLPINTFFRSVALDQKNFAIGVILSGADSDGASGLKTIKEEGGFALVQSPDSAQHGSMPRNSIAADHVDVVGLPAELALELARLAHQFSLPAMVPLEKGEAPTGDDRAFQGILRLLRDVSGLELHLYKPETLRRRIARRMMLQRIETLSEYLRFLQVRNEELRKLQDDILINVTRFFRDPDLWLSLQQTVIPALFQDRTKDRPVRVWCAGCSSGEEAYSLAMVLLEYTAQQGLEVPLQIFGTDASERAIDMARNATYPDTIASEISPERLRRFFVKADRGYQIAKRVRDLCIFARQNLCSDPPFSHIDILSCRNVMIYFNQVLQRQVMATLHYALDPGGYMVLGLSEALRDFGDLFLAIDRKHKIYRKTGTAPLNLELYRTYRALPAPLSKGPVPETVHTWPELEMQRTADRIALARFAPPGMVVDERLNVLQLRGQVAGFLEPGPGTVTWQLQRVLRGDIAGGVTQAVQRAVLEGIAVSSSLLLADKGGVPQVLKVDVLPMQGSDSINVPRCFLIFLQAGDGSEQTAGSPPLTTMSTDERERLIAQQEHDLSATRLHLQSLIEERDGRNQELVAANEEIQASNEELQSTNEELGTTKEELQSANEELQTVNDELHQRNATLAQTGNDLNNLLVSVNIPLLMLTSDLRIRQFTAPMQKLLSVRATDIGRPIGDIRLHLRVENLESTLHEVLDTLGSRELELQDDDGHWYLLRIRPYRTSDDKIEGLVLIVMDIDQLRSSRQELLDARDFARSVVECVPLAVIIARSDMTIHTANTAFRNLTRLHPQELKTRTFPDVLQQLWGLGYIREHIGELFKPEGRQSFEMEHVSTTEDRKVLIVRGQALQADGDRVALIVLEDVTVRRQAETLLSREKSDLETAVASAALTLDRTQVELRSLTSHLFSVQEEERQKVARELHDDISQRLSLVDLLLREVAEMPGPRSKLAEAREQLQSLNTDVRLISHQLHPAVLDELGLSASLKVLVEEFGQREGMPATYLSRNLPTIPMQPAAIAIYRITQEALRNVAKHAGKTHVKVLLEAEDAKLRLQVTDLGMGFDQDSERPNPRVGLGLISMKERAHMAQGTLTITSTLGFGTTVTAELPFDANP